MGREGPGLVGCEGPGLVGREGPGLVRAQVWYAEEGCQLMTWVAADEAMAPSHLGVGNIGLGLG